MKRRLVIASVLKPVDDTRMFEKMGGSLAKHNQFEITIIGFNVNNIPVHQGINFIGLGPAPRISIGRFLTPMKILLKLIQLKPELLIVNTHELLIVSILIRIFFGSQIVYDIRENYYRNVRFSEAFPAWLRYPIALLIRVKERLAAPLFHHFILAEKAYQTEIKFIRKRFTVLQNKAIKPQPLSREVRNSPTRLLFSGTIAKSTGIFEVIELATSLHQLDPNLELSIVGYCAISDLRKEIVALISDKPFIKLNGFDKLVPHQEILEAIATSDFGIIHYPLSPHTEGSIPTKLYEYMAYQLPILCWPDHGYAIRVVQHRAGLLISNSGEALWQEMKTSTFYPNPPENIFWEEEKFIELAQKLVS